MVVAGAVDQQNDADIACRESIDQSCKQLQLELLHQDGIAKQQKAAWR